MTFAEYIEQLAKEHIHVRHSSDECHFSDMTTNNANKLVRQMHYPCIAIDTDGFSLLGASDMFLSNDVYNIYFLTHVRDTGSEAEKQQALTITRDIMNDFIGRISNDKRNLNPVVSRIDMTDADGIPIVFKDIALYGWCLTISCPTLIPPHTCNNHFITE